MSSGSLFTPRAAMIIRVIDKLLLFLGGNGIIGISSKVYAHTGGVVSTISVTLFAGETLSA